MGLYVTVGWLVEGRTVGAGESEVVPLMVGAGESEVVPLIVGVKLGRIVG